MVITGPSSGIGLATAVSTARQGAQMMLAARSKRTLDDVAALLSGHKPAGQVRPLSVSNVGADPTLTHFWLQQRPAGP